MQFREFILNEERLEIGDFIKQERSYDVTYGKVTEKLKNGSFKAVVFDFVGGSFAGKAVIKSLKNWYPPPVKIKETDIPPKILKKINDKIGK